MGRCKCGGYERLPGGIDHAMLFVNFHINLPRDKFMICEAIILVDFVLQFLANAKSFY